MALYHACANALRAIVFYVPGGYTRKFRSSEKFGCERADYILRPYKIFLSVENGGTRVAYIINRGGGRERGKLDKYSSLSSTCTYEDKKIDLIRAKIESVARRKHVCFDYVVEVRGKSGIIIPQEK